MILRAHKPKYTVHLSLCMNNMTSDFRHQLMPNGIKCGAVVNTVSFGEKSHRFDSFLRTFSNNVSDPIHAHRRRALLILVDNCTKNIWRDGRFHWPGKFTTIIVFSLVNYKRWKCVTIIYWRWQLRFFFQNELFLIFCLKRFSFLHGF